MTQFWGHSPLLELFEWAIEVYLFDNICYVKLKYYCSNRVKLKSIISIKVHLNSITTTISNVYSSVYTIRSEFHNFHQTKSLNSHYFMFSYNYLTLSHLNKTAFTCFISLHSITHCICLQSKAGELFLNLHANRSIFNLSNQLFSLCLFTVFFKPCICHVNSAWLLLRLSYSLLKNTGGI